MDKPILLFDLDGTILRINSFPKWVLFMMGRGKPLLTIKTGLTLALRKSGSLSHKNAKQRFQKLWDQYCDEADERVFIEKLHSYIRDEFKPVLELESDKILTTAAAHEYAHPFSRHLKFEHIISTSPHGEPFVENVREQKRDQTLKFLKEKGWETRKRIFFTDHAEDLPLIKECQVVFWFGADEDCPNTEGINIVPSLNLTGPQFSDLVQATLDDCRDAA